MTSPSPVAVIRPVPQLPEFRWNEAANQYIAPNGQFVPRRLIRDQLDQFLAAVTDEMEVVSRRLVAREIALAEWQANMMALSKDANLAGAALERGGWYQLTPADFGRVGAKVRGEYGYLGQFADQVASGEQKLDGTLPRRARLYGEQGRATYYETSRASAVEMGFDQERSVLTPADHCDECVSEAGKGYQPLGTMIPVGSRTCRSNCRCHVVYRNSATGATRLA